MMTLEAELGVRLFDRTTRSLRLTEEGTLLLARARPLIEELREVRFELAGRSGAVRGSLRVSAPTLLGQSLLGGLAARMLDAHPDVSLRFDLADRRVDLIEEGFDAAIRVGEADEAGLIGRRLAMADTLLVAAPSWLARVGEPDGPEALADMDGILFGAPGTTAMWTLSETGGESRAVRVSGRLSCDSLRLCLDAAIAGVGVASIPAFVARPAMEAGDLVRVLPGWTTGRAPIRLLHPSRRLVTPRLRAFIEQAVVVFATAGFEADG